MSGDGKRLALIVEGAGEQKALPGLIHKILKEQQIYSVHFGKEPISTDGKGKLTVEVDRQRHKGIEYFVELAIRNMRADAVLVLLDADKDCSNGRAGSQDGLGPRLLKRARAVSGGRPVAVVVANKEYEAWLVSGWEGIVENLQADPNSQSFGIQPGALSPAQMRDAESLSGYEGLLTEAIGTRYKKTTHQQKLTQLLQVEGVLAPQCHSFQKLVRELKRLVKEM